jgi:type VI secretion system secreted protein VgrG
VATPRIGMEVIFLNGDPDYPILTGCVYNADNMPPWKLPEHKTQSGIKTKSSKGGAVGAGEKNGAGDANAIRFGGKAGQEQLWLHAQKDQLTEVEHDEDKWVGNDRRKTVDRDETNTIHRDRTEVVDRNEKINVHGWRTEEVDLDETITIHQNRTERVDHNETISIGDNRREDVGIDETVAIGKNRTKKVGSNESDDIGKNWTVKIGKMKTETVGIGYTQSTGVFKMVNIGMAYSLNVGMVMNTVVGMMQSAQIGMTKSTTVGTNYSLDVGAAGGVGGEPGGGDNGSSLEMDAKTITLKVGKAMLVMKSSGDISINGKLITIEAKGDDVVISGSQVHLN